MKLKDSKIIQAILSGKDEKAIQELYDSSFIKIREYIKKNSGSREDAQDIFQDAVISFYRIVKAGKFNEEYDIDGFLFTVARNLWINKVKKDNRVIGITDNHLKGTEEYLHQTIVARERETQVQEMFEKTGTKCKELLTLVIYFDFSMKEVSTKLGLSNENAAKTQHYKCKQKLIELLGNNESFKSLLKDAV